MYFLIFIFIGFLISPPTALAQTPVTKVDEKSELPPLEWLDFGEALNAAEVSGRPVLVDVFAPWCPWCSKLQTEVYGKASVRENLNEHFETARLNIEDKDLVIEFKGFELSSSELAAGLGAEGTPTVVFLSSTGDYITRVPGFIDAEEFNHVLRYISSGSYQRESFKDYRLRNP